MFEDSPPCAPDVPALDALANLALIVGALALVVALVAFALGRSEFRRPPWMGRFTIGGVVLGVGLILLAWFLHAPWC
ncbi:hypothetical protein [Nocardioides zeae]|uniref:Uncharacterized protein n=1 Tax=Nocardioides zeae TaxID=1457234 RepID=A0AAJ1UAK7_9ACTN|nr:hypothetical protein [Nocardioides zeae]MDQ1106617.1 hypothetical protein [Nocardioides zeae]